MRTKAKGDSFRACWGCDHWRRVGDATTCMACHYALDTGRCRSPICPPGEGCTVREERGVRVPWSPAHKYQIPPKAYRPAVKLQAGEGGHRPGEDQAGL